jgi:hypothetical protein
MKEYLFPQKPFSEWTNEELKDFRAQQLRQQDKTFNIIVEAKAELPIREKIMHHDDKFETYNEMYKNTKYVSIGAYSHLSASIKYRDMYIRQKYCT